MTRDTQREHDDSFVMAELSEDDRLERCYRRGCHQALAIYGYALESLGEPLPASLQRITEAVRQMRYSKKRYGAFMHQALERARLPQPGK